MKTRRIRPAGFSVCQKTVFLLTQHTRRLASAHPLRGDGGCVKTHFLLSRQKKMFLVLQKKRRLCAWFGIADEDFRRAKSGLSLRSLSAAAPALLHPCFRFSIKRLLPANGAMWASLPTREGSYALLCHDFAERSGVEGSMAMDLKLRCVRSFVAALLRMTSRWCGDDRRAIYQSPLRVRRTAGGCPRVGRDALCRAANAAPRRAAGQAPIWLRESRMFSVSAAAALGADPFKSRTPETEECTEVCSGFFFWGIQNPVFF